MVSGRESRLPVPGWFARFARVPFPTCPLPHVRRAGKHVEPAVEIVLILPQVPIQAAGVLPTSSAVALSSSLGSSFPAYSSVPRRIRDATVK